MKLLILGGTRFSGWFTATMALERGHEVTLLHRGRSPLDGLDRAEHLVGDRDPGVSDVLDAVRARPWEAVIDFCGFVPRVVEAAANALSGAGHYTFVSTGSVYADASAPGITEGAPLAGPPPPEVEEVTNETYGGLKVACERIVQADFGDRACIVRPGLIVGPRDPTDRFSYWPVRIAEGGQAVAPAPASGPVQGIDARDLARFLLQCAEQSVSGVFNAVGEPTPFGDLLEACRAAAGPEAADIRWCDPAWLEAHEVQPWSDLPLWLGTDPAFAGFNQVSNAAARAAGLRIRPLADTASDTLAWFRAHRGGRADLSTGLSAEREAALLAAMNLG